MPSHKKEKKEGKKFWQSELKYLKRIFHSCNRKSNKRIFPYCNRKSNKRIFPRKGYFLEKDISIDH
jgi:hypothetical protein